MPIRWMEKLRPGEVKGLTGVGGRNGTRPLLPTLGKSPALGYGSQETDVEVFGRGDLGWGPGMGCPWAHSWAQDAEGLC